MSDLIQRVEAAVRERGLLASGRKVLIAVSGGLDSMVLLHVFQRLAKPHRWRIVVAHFNHRLRGRASDADERLVRATAAKLRLKFIGGGVNVKALVAGSKMSVEMAARKLRHEFLADAARTEKTSTIALAHHADDQVELFFLRLLRGAGGEGLAGMRWRSPSPVDKSIALVRPLLGFTKADLAACARDNGIAFREDATNATTDFLRNRIRRELLPLLRKQYQPAIDKVVLRAMDIAGAEAEFAAAAARSYCACIAGATAGDFGALPVAVQRKALQQQLTAAGLLPDFDLVEKLRAAPGVKVSVCAGLGVERSDAGEIRCQAAPVAGFDPAEAVFKLSGGQGRVKFANRQFRWRLEPAEPIMPPPKKPAAPAALEFFDAGKIGGEIILRHWRAGDRFQPIGLKSSAKLQDLFVNAKIPARRRRELTLAATAAGEIFWVESLRIGENFKLTPATRLRFAWEFGPAP